MNQQEMDKIYNSQTTEEKWRKIWTENQVSKFDLAETTTGGKEIFSICLPPPNVTGSLHMGHAFQQTLMDVLIRYNKMMGKNSLWQVGVDHAGIATQLIVQNKLANEQPNKVFTKDELIAEIWKWKAESGNLITTQMQFMGNFVDWSRSRFTMDDDFVLAIKKIFILLYDEGLIYRGQKLVNWDTSLQTAVSDLEVVSEEKNGLMYHLAYDLVDGGQIIVATTRPETLFGDLAIAVHPDSDKKHLIGKEALVPLVGRKIKIIADEMVDKDFGSGFVKITPAHDFKDYEVGLRHNLGFLNILNPDGTLNNQVPPEYVGLDRYAARKKLVLELESSGNLVKKDQHKLVLPTSERTGTVVEPMLTNQWFMKMRYLADEAVRLVAEGEIKFFPDNWKNTYFSWLENIDDWCISRQLVWGHTIPIFYDEAGKAYAGSTEDEIRAKYKLPIDTKLTQEKDVIDTWFSSAAWTFITTGFQNDHELYQHAHPTDVLITGFDIIFFWVARMIMLTKKITGQIPFKAVYFTGLVRDAHGQKMSKSKGNVIDPVDIVQGISLEELLVKRTGFLISDDKKVGIVKQTTKDYPNGIDSYGIDSLRATFLSLCSGGRDIKFDFLRLRGYRNFTNKIWNAAKFIFSNCEDFMPGSAPTDFDAEDLWILGKFNQLIANFHKDIAEFRFDYLITDAQDFFWKSFCDWYLEIAKLSLDLPQKRYQKQWVLLFVLNNFMKLAHPLMPFLTDELGSRLAKIGGRKFTTLSLETFPKGLELDAEKNAEFNLIIELISKLRAIRSAHQLQKSELLEVQILHKRLPENEVQLIEKLGSAKLQFVAEIGGKFTGFSLVENMELYLTNELDQTKELARIANEIKEKHLLIQKLLASGEKLQKDNLTKLTKECEILEKKLLLLK